MTDNGTIGTKVVKGCLSKKHEQQSIIHNYL